MSGELKVVAWRKTHRFVTGRVTHSLTDNQEAADGWNEIGHPLEPLVLASEATERIAAERDEALAKVAEMEKVLEEAKALADSEGSRAVKYLRVVRKVRAVVNEWPEVDMPGSPLSRIRTIVAFAGGDSALGVGGREGA